MMPKITDMKHIGMILLLGLVFLGGIMVSLAEADSPLQTDQRLSEKTIYIGLANNEISLFNRSDTGASRLSALLVRDGADLKVLNWELPVPEEADIVILLSPATDYSGTQMAKLWTYINNGGSLLVVADPSDALSSRSALVDLLWNSFGLGIEKVVLIDITSEDEAQTSHVEFQERLAEHPVLENIDLETLVLDTACSLRTEELVLSDISVAPLLGSTERFYGEMNLRSLFNESVFELNIGEDLAPGSHLLAAAAESNQTGTRIAVLCDSDLVLNNAGFLTSPPGSSRFLYPGAVQLTLNTVYWLLNVQPPELDFEAPAPTATPTITPSPTSSPTPEATAGGG